MLCGLVGQNNCFGATAAILKAKTSQLFQRRQNLQSQILSGVTPCAHTGVRKIALTCNFSKLVVCFASFSGTFQKTWQAKVQNYEMAQDVRPICKLNLYEFNPFQSTSRFLFIRPYFIMACLLIGRLWVFKAPELERWPAAAEPCNREA
jgi:hypothetical protein